jgi:hypothetical protein
LILRSIAGAGRTHFQATLTEIEEIANKDVEMQVRCFDCLDRGRVCVREILTDYRQPPPQESTIYIVVDTNILLGYYEALRTFLEDVEKVEAPVVAVFPGIVVQELDR